MRWLPLGIQLLQTAPQPRKPNRQQLQLLHGCRGSTELQALTQHSTRWWLGLANGTSAPNTTNNSPLGNHRHPA